MNRSTLEGTLPEHILSDTTMGVLGGGSLAGTVLLGGVIVVAVLLIWFPPPLVAMIRRIAVPRELGRRP